MWTHGNAPLGEVNLHYLSAGSGRLILFLHGFPEFWYAWKDQLAEFSRDAQAVACDLRGYNLSSKPADVRRYEMPHLVADVLGLIRHLQHDRAVLVGHDWGGIIAWAAAALHPEAVERLVTINAPHPNVFQERLRTDPAQQQASRYMLEFRNPDAEAKLSAHCYSLLSAAVLGEGLRDGYLDEEDQAAYLDAWSRPGALTGGLNYYRAARLGPPDPAFEPAPDLPPLRIPVPTLVIWGEQDPYLLPSNLEGLERWAPDLEVVRVPDAGHWIVHQKPSLVNETIRRFLEREPPSARPADFLAQ